jgi:hypothetical protein
MPTPYRRFFHAWKGPLAWTSASVGAATVAGAWSAFGSAGSIAAAIAGITGAGAAITGATVAQAAVIVWTGGAALVAVPFAYALAKATFLRKDRRSATDKEMHLSNRDLKDPMNWDCYWTTVVVVGCGRTGKTHLKQRLRGTTGEIKSTESLEIHLCCLDTIRKAYIALLDDKGAKQGESTNRILSLEQRDLINTAAQQVKIAAELAK